MNNRYKHHPPTSDQVVAAHQAIRVECDYFDQLITSVVPAGREEAIARTKLEELMMWCNAGIARNQ